MDENVRRADMKQCSECTKWKRLNGKNFYANSVCGACYQKRYKIEKPDSYRDTKLRHMYGITLVEYTSLLAAQGNKCAICPRTDNNRADGKFQNFVVDHRHSDGKVRALLCHSCNKNVGVMEKWGSDLQTYLNKYQK